MFLTVVYKAFHWPVKISKGKAKCVPVKFYDTQHYITTFKTAAGKSYEVVLK